MRNNLDALFTLTSKFGLSNIEIVIYLKLLERGTLTFTRLATECKIPRTTIYEKIDKLINKGLVTITFKGNRKWLVAESPKGISTFLMREQLKYEKKLTEVAQMQEEVGIFSEMIKAFVPTDSEKQQFTIKYFEGIEGFLEVHQRTLDSLRKELLFISNMNEWKKVFTDDFAYKYYVPKRIEKRIFAKTLAIDSEIARRIRKQDKKYFREMRFLPKNINFQPTLIISDDEISIMISTEPYAAIQIRNTGLADMFRSMFNYLWLQSM